MKNNLATIINEFGMNIKNNSIHKARTPFVSKLKRGLGLELDAFLHIQYHTMQFMHMPITCVQLLSFVSLLLLPVTML